MIPPQLRHSNFGCVCVGLGSPSVGLELYANRPPPARPPARRGPGPRQQFQARAPSPGRNCQSSELGDFAVRSLTSPEALLSARQASFAAPEELPGERRVPVRLDGGGWSPRDTPRTRKGSPGGAR